MQMNENKKIGLCLSGGGSRAVAFHLGCLRALNDLGILSRVSIISAVSGGSIVAGIFAYASSDFDEFDKRAVNFLRQGLVRKAMCRYIFCGYFILEWLNWIIIVFASLFGRAVERLLGRFPTFLYVRRFFSRTKVLIEVLDSTLFDGRKLNLVSRSNLQVVFNSTELTTCTAFRFGSNEVSCWKFGKVDSTSIRVAEAVGCSAAYPVFLPAIDRKYTFKASTGEAVEHRIVLTDGGIYENLGLSPLVPDRKPGYGYSALKCDLVIACDAGNRIEDISGHSQWIIPRLVKCFTSVMRRVQSLNFKILHDFKQRGEISDFILANLSQDDSKLTKAPNNLVRREEVENYPTDFSAMSEEDIGKLSSRGEQLVRALVSQYLPKI